MKLSPHQLAEFYPRGPSESTKVRSFAERLYAEISQDTEMTNSKSRFFEFMTQISDEIIGKPEKRSVLDTRLMTEIGPATSKEPDQWISDDLKIASQMSLSRLKSLRESFASSSGPDIKTTDRNQNRAVSNENYPNNFNPPKHVALETIGRTGKESFPSNYSSNAPPPSQLQPQLQPELPPQPQERIFPVPATEDKQEIRNLNEMKENPDNSSCGSSEESEDESERQVESPTPSPSPTHQFSNYNQLPIYPTTTTLPTNAVEERKERHATFSSKPDEFQASESRRYLADLPKTLIADPPIIASIPPHYGSNPTLPEKQSFPTINIHNYLPLDHFPRIEVEKASPKKKPSATALKYAVADYDRLTESVDLSGLSLKRIRELTGLE